MKLLTVLVLVIGALTCSGCSLLSQAQQNPIAFEQQVIQDTELAIDAAQVVFATFLPSLGAAGPADQTKFNALLTDVQNAEQVLADAATTVLQSGSSVDLTQLMANLTTTVDALETFINGLKSSAANTVVPNALDNVVITLHKVVATYRKPS
jgi:hypothetical protein